jgi:hypothetical protein
VRIASILLAAAACSSSPKAQTPEAPLPGETPTETYVSQTCVPAGFYKVTVDLTTAQITQVNTGMTDTKWCESLLTVVPNTELKTMRIAYENGVLGVKWPPQRRVSAVSKGECELEISDEPVPMTVKFENGKGTGTSTYSLGSDNHPDEKCTATNAKFLIERAGD